MTNSRLHALIALGGVLIVGAFVAFLPSVSPASERSEVHRICREEGINQASELAINARASCRWARWAMSSGSRSSLSRP